MAGLINSFWEGGAIPNAWDSSDLVATGESIVDSANSVFMKPDGLEVYSYVFSATINQYTLTTPFDLSTASFTRTTTYAGLTQGISFRESDGKKMYSFGGTSFKEFDLSTGWDISTLSLLRTETVPTYMTGCYVKQDGTTMYTSNQTTEDIYEYDLSTPWDISTLSLTNSFDVATESINAQSVFWKPDGTLCYVGTASKMSAYDVSPAWDVTGMIYNSSLSSSAVGSRGLWWKPDGLYCLACQQSTNGLQEYTIT